MGGSVERVYEGNDDFKQSSVNFKFHAPFNCVS